MRYFILDTLPFPPGRMTIVLDASYDTFARLHGVGACEVEISLPDGTSFSTPASISVIDGGDVVAAQPRVMLYQTEARNSLPKGAVCRINIR